MHTTEDADVLPFPPLHEPPSMMAAPPPVPVLPAKAPQREQVLRAYAQRTVDRLGVGAALWLVAELEEAVAEAREKDR
jgi:hypothetical protein